MDVVSKLKPMSFKVEHVEHGRSCSGQFVRPVVVVPAAGRCGSSSDGSSGSSSSGGVSSVGLGRALATAGVGVAASLAAKVAAAVMVFACFFFVSAAAVQIAEV